MANKKITELDAATTLASTDVVPVVDVSEDVTKKITTTNLFRTLPDGTAAAPALAFSSDQANGVYLAGTDTVGISTGGTQRVTVDGSGNVTISGNLQVDGATTTVQSTTVTIDDKNLELGSVASPSNTTADGGGITLKGATDKTLKWIDSTGCWTFNQPMNFNDHVRIDSSGRVGIGATSPAKLLEVRVAEDSSDGIRVNEIGDTYHDILASQGNLFIHADSKGDNGTQHVLRFGVGSSGERMRIDSSGRLLVGTTTEGHADADNLTITDSGNCGLTIRSGSSNAGSIYFSDATSGAAEYDGYIAYNQNSRYLRFGTAQTERLRIDSSGRVGVGTTSPGSKLELSGSGNACELRLRSTDTTNAIIRSYVNSLEAGKIAFTSGRELFIETAGSERLRIDSSGRLLVGTSTSQGNRSLQIEGDAASADNPGSILLRRGLTSAEIGSVVGRDLGEISFGTQDGDIGALILAESDGTMSSGDSPARLVFSTTADGASSPTERMRIDSSGKVGIGEAAPAADLVVKQSGNTFTTASQTVALFQRSSTTGHAAKIAIVGGNAASSDINFGDTDDEDIGSIIYVHTDNSLRFTTNTSERMRIDSSGNVGIGTSSPSAQIHLNQSGTGSYSTLKLSNSGASGRTYEIGVGGSTSGSGYAGNLYFYDSTASALRAVIDSSGKVGIGTTSPDSNSLLSVNGVINLPDDVAIAWGGGTNRSSWSGNKASGFLRAYTNGSERMRIDSSGRLLLGTTTARANLTVALGNGSIPAAGASTGAAVFSNGTDGAVYGVVVGANTSGTGYIQSQRTDGTATTYNLAVQPNGGNVLIRTTTEGHANADNLTVADSGNGGITIRTGTTHQGSLYFSDGTSGDAEYDGFINYKHDIRTFRIGTAATTRLSINSNGAWGLEGDSNYGTSGQVLTSNGNDSPTWQTPSSGAQIIEGNTNVECVDTGSNGHILFDTEGSERMRIDSSGNVGIGTASPVSILDVTVGGSGSRKFVANYDNSVITIKGSNASSNPESLRVVGDSIRFNTGTSGSGTERMRIASDGTVGIGCVPNSFQSGYDAVQIGGNLVLNVDSTGAGAGVYMGNNVYRDSGNSRWEYINTDEASQYYQANGEHVWRYAASGSANAAITWSEAMRIDSSGNVGIGGNGTGTGLGVYLQKTGSSAHFYEASDGTKKMIVGADSTIDYVKMGALSNHPVGFVVNNGEKMRIDSSGNVGIGTTTIEANSNYNTLEIAGDTSSGGAIVRLKTGDRSTAKTMLFCDTGGFEARVETNHPAIFSTNNTERMRLDSSGRLLIGTTTEGHTAADDLTIATTGNTGITLRSGTSNNGNLYFSDATSGTAEHAGFVQYNHANNQLRFGSGGTERLRITSAGDVQVKDFSPRIGAALTAVSGNFSSYFGASGTSNSNLPMIVERYNDNGVSIEFKRSNSVVGNINVTASSTNYATSSDHRLKENVVDLDGAITRVKQLAPKRFNFIVDADTTVDGFLAHEAATVVPEAVTGTHNEVDDENNPVYQGIDQSKLVPLLTAALQEAIAKIETLEAKVAALEAS